MPWSSSVRAHMSPEMPAPTTATLGIGSHNGRVVCLQVTIGIKSLGVFLGGTVPDRAEDGSSRREGPIELAETPEDSAVGSGVSSVERVTMVQIDHRGQGRLRIGRPVEQCLAPRHPHVVVKLAVNQQRALGGVPQLVAGCSSGQGLPRVDRGPVIRLVLGQAIRGPNPAGRPGFRDRDGRSKMRRPIPAKSAVRPGTSPRPSIADSAASRAIRSGDTIP